MKQFDKFIIKVLLLTLLIGLLHSCRYSKPILRVLVKIDTTLCEDTLQVEKIYKYLRHSRYGNHGLLIVKHKYDKNKKVTYSGMYKRSTDRKIFDGKQNFIEKYKVFKNGKLIRKYRYMRKNRGLGGRLICKKTYYYNDNGKLINIIDGKKDRKNNK